MGVTNCSLIVFETYRKQSIFSIVSLVRKKDREEEGKEKVKKDRKKKEGRGRKEGKKKKRRRKERRNHCWGSYRFGGKC